MDIEKEFSLADLFSECLHCPRLSQVKGRSQELNSDTLWVAGIHSLDMSPDATKLESGAEANH